MSKESRVNNLTEADISALHSALGPLGSTPSILLEINVSEIAENMRRLCEGEAIPSINNAVAYQRFDPSKILAEFKSRAEKHLAGPNDTPICVTKVSGVEIPIYEKCHLATDAAFFIVLFLEMGNNVSKILLKCRSIEDIIRRKCAYYGIALNSRAPGSASGSTVMTLARISRAFAGLSAAIIARHSIVGELKSKFFAGINLPIIMTHSIFTDLIPSDNRELSDIAKYLHLERTIMLCKPMDKWEMVNQTMAYLLERSEAFVSSAISGSILTDDRRVKAMQKCQVLIGSTLSPVVLSMHAITTRLSGMGDLTYNEAVKRITAEINPPQVN